MPATFEALLVLAIALLPGALYLGALERFVGPWWSRTSDRVFRFLEVSAIFHVLAAPLTYNLWTELVLSGRVRQGRASWSAWGWLLIYVVVPLGVGALVGFGARERWSWTRFFTGPNPAPRAWDFFFSTRPDGWIRLRLKSGIWLGGAYARSAIEGSYAAGYPEAQDLFLAETVETDPETGEFLFDDDDSPRLRGSGILIRWEEVEYFEFIDA